MTFELRVTSFDVTLADKTKVHSVMAEKYLKIVQGNFGPNGQHRPTPWQPLSGAYIAHLHHLNQRTLFDIRSTPTLYRTGNLFRSIKASATDQSGTVMTDSPYAEIQQQGGTVIGDNGRHWKIPPRPYFPFYRDGTPTDYAVDQVTKAAEQEILRQNP